MSSEVVDHETVWEPKIESDFARKNACPQLPPLCERFVRKIGSENLIRILFRHNG